MKIWPRLAMLLALLFLGSLVSPNQNAAQPGADPVRLVVVVLGGLNTFSGAGTFASITPALERLGTAPEVNPAVSVEEFSYRYPELSYGRCDTNQPIAESARRLNEQVRDLADRHPNARFMVLGHSLGGVIATYWAVDAPPGLLARTAAVVTLDSPLQGLGDVPAELSDLITGWVTTQLCADRRVLDELTPGGAPGPLAAAGRAFDALSAAGARLYAGASRGDIPISWRSATLPGAETRYFDSGVCADWTGLAATVPGLGPDVRASDWARVRTQLATLPPQTQRALLDRLAACLDTSHGNVLRDPAVIGWLVDIAQTALASAPAPVATP